MNSRLEFGQHLIDRGLIGVGVEVGTLYGEYAECLLATWPGKLHCIDPWIQQSAKIYRDGCNSIDFDEAFERVKKRLVQYNERVTLHRLYSFNAVIGFRDDSLSFVYLDANHDFDHVRADIRGWWPRIKSGGILCGHDYKDEKTDYWNCGVKSAVDEFVAENNLKLTLTPECTSWWIDKP